MFPKFLEISLFAYQLFIPEGTQTYHENVKKMFKLNVFENTYHVESLGSSGEENIGEFHQKIADLQRCDIQFTAKHLNDNIKSENCLLFQGTKDIPIIFIDKYVLKPKCDMNDNEMIFDMIDNLESERGSLSMSGKNQGRYMSVRELERHTSDSSRQQGPGEWNPEEIRNSPHRESRDMESEFTAMGDWEDPQPRDSDLPKMVRIQPMLLERREHSECPIHLVVLVHGYQGSSYDLAFLKNNLTFLAGDQVSFYCSTINESDSSKCIDDLGLNLSLEVRDIIRSTCSHFNHLSSISFIGHSLGGLIIRAALPRLSEFRGKMKSLITFGTPHLGCSTNPSSIVKTGMKVWSKVSKHVALRQMVLEDTIDVRDSFLMALSTYEVGFVKLGDRVV